MNIRKVYVNDDWIRIDELRAAGYEPDCVTKDGFVITFWALGFLIQPWTEEYAQVFKEVRYEQPA